MLDGMETTAAMEHFAGKLAYETDVSDVHAALSSGEPGFVLVDSRSRAAWDQGHVPGAIHLPTREIGRSAGGLIPAGAAVVTYCWGPGCNGATRAALAFARLGYPVREMIGGFEYWVREGFAYETAARGRGERAADPLTAPVNEPVTVPVNVGEGHEVDSSNPADPTKLPGTASAGYSADSADSVSVGHAADSPDSPDPANPVILPSAGAVGRTSAAATCGC